MKKPPPDIPVHRRFAPTALMFGNIVTGCSILAPAGMLIELAADLDITVHTAGLLVTFGAIVLCIGSPLTAWLTSRIERRTLLAFTLAVLVLGNIASAFAPSYAALLIVRLIMLAVGALYTPQAAGTAALIVPAEKRGGAIAYVFLGWSLAAAVGLPLITFLTSHYGWRAAYGGISIIADEVYNRLVYDRPVAPSFLEIATPDDPVFVVNSFSKTWAMTGWRVGWMVMPRQVAPIFERLLEFNTSGGQSFLQWGCVAAIRQGEDFVKSMVARCKSGRDLVIDRLAQMNRVSVIPNQASFYLMLQVADMTEPLDFCKKLVVEGRVGLAPGTAFGKGGDSFLRLCYAQSEARLSEAMDRFSTFLAKY